LESGVVISVGVKTVSHVAIEPQVRVQEHRSSQDARSLSDLEMLNTLRSIKVVIVVWVTGRGGGVRLEIVASLDWEKRDQTT
jgi:hypothetical protein